MLVLGDAEIWEDLQFPAQAVNPAGLASPPTWDADHCGWSFAPDPAENVIQIVAQMPHSWREGSEIRPHLHLKTLSAVSGKTVTWELKYRRAFPNSGIWEDWTTLTTTWNVPNVSGASRIHPLGDIDMTGYTASAMIDFQITRKAAGAADLGVAIILKQFDAHRQVDSLGSIGEYVKTYEP